MTTKKSNSLEKNWVEITQALADIYGDELTSEEFCEPEPEPLKTSFREMLSQQQQAALRRLRNQLPKH